MYIVNTSENPTKGSKWEHKDLPNCVFQCVSVKFTTSDGFLFLFKEIDPSTYEFKFPKDEPVGFNQAGVKTFFFPWKDPWASQKKIAKQYGFVWRDAPPEPTPTFKIEY